MDRETLLTLANRWTNPDLVSSKYIWLPLTIVGTTLLLDYRDEWRLDVTTGLLAP